MGYPRTFKVDVNSTVLVVVHDPDVIERVTGPGGDEWRRQMYGSVRTEQDVVEHLAINHHQRVAMLLDGWSDVAIGAATMRLQSSVGSVEEI